MEFNRNTIYYNVNNDLILNVLILKVYETLLLFWSNDHAQLSLTGIVIRLSVYIVIL